MTGPVFPRDGFEEQFEQIHAAEHVCNVSDERMRQVLEHTENDSSLQALISVIQTGWPKSKSALPVEVQQYFSIRDELIVDEGIIFKGSRIVIPTSLRKEMIAYTTLIWALLAVSVGHVCLSISLR